MTVIDLTLQSDLLEPNTGARVCSAELTTKEGLSKNGFCLLDVLFLQQCVFIVPFIGSGLAITLAMTHRVWKRAL